MQKINFVLSVHQRKQLALAHWDILSFCPINYDAVIVSTSRLPVPHVEIPVSNHPIGCLSAVVAGLKEAKKRNWRSYIHRNSDDWIFNWQFVMSNWHKFHKGNYKFAGYNWFANDSNNEYAVNENIIDVATYAPHINEIERYFSTVKCKAEYSFAAMMNKFINPNQFMRLLGREIPSGIGTNRRNKGINNRYFNLEWQLISSHNEAWRSRYLHMLDISYIDELEKLTHFSKWKKSLNKIFRKK